MIEERYCSYEVARLLKEKGFDEECHHIYVGVTLEWTNTIYGDDVISNNEIPDVDTDVITAPTHQMACDWLMEKDIYISPKYSCFRSRKGAPHYEWKPVILRLSTFNIIYPQLLDVCEYYKTYGEAVDAAMQGLILSKFDYFSEIKISEEAVKCADALVEKLKGE